MHFNNNRNYEGLSITSFPFFDQVCDRAKGQLISEQSYVCCLKFSKKATKYCQDFYPIREYLIPSLIWQFTLEPFISLTYQKMNSCGFSKGLMFDCRSKYSFRQKKKLRHLWIHPYLQYYSLRQFHGPFYGRFFC